MKKVFLLTFSFFIAFTSISLFFTQTPTEAIAAEDYCKFWITSPTDKPATPQLIEVDNGGIFSVWVETNRDRVIYLHNIGNDIAIRDPLVGEDPINMPETGTLRKTYDVDDIYKDFDVSNQLVQISVWAYDSSNLPGQRTDCEKEGGATTINMQVGLLRGCRRQI